MRSVPAAKSMNHHRQYLFVFILSFVNTLLIEASTGSIRESLCEPFRVWWKSPKRAFLVWHRNRNVATIDNKISTRQLSSKSALQLALDISPGGAEFDPLTHEKPVKTNRYFDVLPEIEIELNHKSHELEIATNTGNASYYMGPCERPSALFETKGYDVGNFTLPDFDDEFRKSRKGDDNNKLVHVTSRPMLTSEECDEIISLAEEHFTTTVPGGWTTLPSGRYSVSGSWIKDIPPVLARFNSLLQTRIFPALAQLFPNVVTDPSKLCIQSAYLFKYTPESGAKTDMHMDSSLLSFAVLLNDPSEFEGGGTFYESLGEHGDVVRMKKGDVTFRPSALRHRAEPITRGVRYVIGGFVAIAGRDGCEHTRQLLTRGTKALANGDTITAKRLFELARDIRPDFSETHMSVAHCLRKIDDAAGALKAYHSAFDANPRSADSAFMVGVMHGERGDDEAAMRWYKIATRLNEYDGDAWYRQGLIHGRWGDAASERAMYEKAISVQPDHADAYCNLGVSYGEVGDEEKEVECYERALLIEPDNEDALSNAKAAYYYRGINAYNAGHIEKALASFRRILDDIAPGEPSIMEAYEAVLGSKKKWDDANKVIEDKPE